MGADQSTGGNVQLKSQRDEDIPYTSYSLSKPIDGGRLFIRILLDEFRQEQGRHILLLSMDNVLIKTHVFNNYHNRGRMKLIGRLAQNRNRWKMHNYI